MNFFNINRKISCFFRPNSLFLQSKKKAMESKDIIGVEELTDMILPYITTKAVLWSKVPYNQKYKEGVREDIKVCLNGMLENSFSKQFEKEYVYTNFPFLDIDPEEYKATEEFLDEALLLAYILNDYVKHKTLSPKEVRTFYEAKNNLICLIYNYWGKKVTEVWSESVEASDSLYVCFRIQYKTDEDFVFHQPYKNVQRLFNTKRKRDELLASNRPYGRKSEYAYLFTDDEKRVMKIAYNLFLIYVKVLISSLIFKTSWKEGEIRNGDSR